MSVTILNCLKSNGGIIVPIYLREPALFQKIRAEDVSLSVKAYGVDVTVKDAIIPIPEFMLDYFVENRTITIYLADDSEYMWEPIAAIEVPKEQIVEARGAYKFMQSKGTKSATLPN